MEDWTDQARIRTLLSLLEQNEKELIRAQNYISELEAKIALASPSLEVVELETKLIQSYDEIANLKDILVIAKIDAAKTDFGLSKQYDYEEAYFTLRNSEAYRIGLLLVKTLKYFVPIKRRNLSLLPARLRKFIG
jgi:hypothetical protein